MNYVLMFNEYVRYVTYQQKPIFAGTEACILISNDKVVYP